MTENSSAVLAFEKAQELATRVDAFFNRRERREKLKEAKKAAKRAKRDCDDPLAAPQTRQYEGPPDFREDYVPEERKELRTGSLSKGSE